MEDEQIRQVIEAALLASDGPLTVANLAKLFAKGELDEENETKQIRDALSVLEEESATRGVELKRVASGYRYQVRQGLSQWVSRLWDEKPPRYTRALLETLSLIAYKQPVTRGDIEQVRGVGVSQNIMRTLVERDWIRIVGQREVPGRPSLYGTTKAFLDYFSLKSLDELPPLAEIRALIEPALVEEIESEEIPVPVADPADQVDGLEAETAQSEAIGSEVSGEAADSEAQHLQDAGGDETEAQVIAAHVDVITEPSADAEVQEQNVSADVVQLHGSSQSNP